MMRFLKSISDVTLTVVAVALCFAYFTPTSYWYVANGEAVFDARVGEDVIMVSDRVIVRDFSGKWTATVRSLQSDKESLSVVCSASGALNYKTNSVLPEVLTLDWWTEGACDTNKMGPGSYLLETCHRVYTGIFGVTREICRTSNIFKVIET